MRPSYYPPLPSPFLSFCLTYLSLSYCGAYQGWFLRPGSMLLYFIPNLTTLLLLCFLAHRCNKGRGGGGGKQTALLLCHLLYLARAIIVKFGKT